LWFDLVLTGLQSIHAPIPLGGTSNHFRTKDLLALKGWDAFNVTEDCDLGIRLVKHGYRTAIINSVTLEEANSSMWNWFRQRTRWIKGYMQTYMVHMRRPDDFLHIKKKSHIITFQLIVGGKILSMFINPMMWAITISYFALRATVGKAIESFYPPPVLYMGAFSLIFGNFLYLYYYMIGCAKRGQDDIIKYVFLVPFYWLGMSVAAWVASTQFLIRPHHWAKTKHGLHLQQGQSETEKVTDRNLLEQTTTTMQRAYAVKHGFT
jgi:cellulose synthase/poly-beta-1,6-N-acetylglucosamine synthase-like glycosyltransferase